MSAGDDVYRSHALRLPEVEELKGIAAEAGLSVSDNAIHDYQSLIKDMIGCYDRVMELAESLEDLPPVKYPRIPGIKPRPEDNIYNAWTYKLDLRGSSTGLLCGKTVAVKDSISIAGVPMMNGSHVLDGYLPRIDATVITRVLDEGGVIKGKTVCEDFCFSGLSIFCNTGVVRNPIDPTRSSGGSSAGCAVVVAMGEVDMAIGGDQGGSIRIPASWCGIVGLKPTFGLVPYTGICSLEPTVDHTGPMARTVHDCALLLQALAGYDQMDPRQQPREKQDYMKQLTGVITGKKIGLLKEGFTRCDSKVSELVKTAAELFTKAGATVDEVSIPSHNDAELIWAVCCKEGAAYTMIDLAAMPMGVHGYYDTHLHDYVNQMLKVKKNEMSPELKNIIIHANYVKKHYGNKFYGKAMNLIPWLIKQYDTALQEYDVLVMPTLPEVAPKLPRATDNELDIMKWAVNMVCNTAAFDATGHPALSINAGYIEGLPVGLMIVGRHWDEGNVLNIAYTFEQLQKNM